jgi:very-short-patch-repair endonuclease
MAVAAGLVTSNALRGPRFARLFPDVYVSSCTEVDLALRSAAAAVYVGWRGVMVGYSAAELHGASCAPRGAAVEVTVPGGEVRARPGLRVHRFRPLPEELTVRREVVMTTPLRTAYDLGRRPDLTEGVVGIDALARACGFVPETVLEVTAAHPGDRGMRTLRRAVALSDGRAGSPMETRIRVAIHRYRLPAPEIQHPVGPYLLDLAYPAVRLALEYDGRDHRTAQRAIRDLRREAYLTARGWEVLRLRASSVFDPREAAILVHRELVGRGYANVARALPQPRW